MKTIIVRSTWRAEDRIEVSDEEADRLINGGCTYLSAFSDEVLEQVDASGAELVDWDVREVTP